MPEPKDTAVTIRSRWGVAWEPEHRFEFALACSGHSWSGTVARGAEPK
jgi:hypothetical protein